MRIMQPEVNSFIIMHPILGLSNLTLSNLSSSQHNHIGEQIVIVGEENDTLGPGGCRALVNAMIGNIDESAVQHPYAATKDLRILRSGIKDSGADAISELLFATARSDQQAEWKIEYLELSDNDISASGAHSIGRGLSVGMNKTLTSLVMDFNRTLQSNGVAALCKGLATNSTLKKLSLKHCGIDETGAAPIAHVLLFNRSALMSLDLTGNSLKGHGLIDLCDGLKENCSLKAIRLAENGIGQSEGDLKSLQILSNVLSTNNSLMAVDLLHNRIGTKGGSILLNSVKGNTVLTEFKVDSNNMENVVYNALYKMSTKQSEKKKGGSKTKK